MSKTQQAKNAREEMQVQAVLGRTLLQLFAALPSADKIALPENAADRAFAIQLCKALSEAMLGEGTGIAVAARQIDTLSWFFMNPEAFEGAPYPTQIIDDIPF